MATKIKIKNGPAQIEVEEVVIGSRFQVAFKVEQETGPNTGVFAAVNLTGYTLQAHVKDNLRNDTLPDVEFTITKRNQTTETGWVDLLLDGTVTSSLSEKTYYASLKMWETGSPELGDTLAVITMPVKYEATR
jgi:hypothetical protein